MAKGIAYDEETVLRCLQALDEGTPPVVVSEVEGVGLATLYNWRARRDVSGGMKIDLQTSERKENERLRAENARLRLMVSKTNALIDELLVMRRRLESAA